MNYTYIYVTGVIATTVIPGSLITLSIKQYINHISNHLPWIVR